MGIRHHSTPPYYTGNNNFAVCSGQGTTCNTVMPAWASWTAALMNISGQDLTAGGYTFPNGAEWSANPAWNNSNVVFYSSGWNAAPIALMNIQVGINGAGGNVVYPAPNAVIAAPPCSYSSGGGNAGAGAIFPGSYQNGTTGLLFTNLSTESHQFNFHNEPGTNEPVFSYTSTLEPGQSCYESNPLDFMNPQYYVQSTTSNHYDGIIATKSNWATAFLDITPWTGFALGDTQNINNSNPNNSSDAFYLGSFCSSPYNDISDMNSVIFPPIGGSNVITFGTAAFGNMSPTPNGQNNFAIPNGNAYVANSLFQTISHTGQNAGQIVQINPFGICGYTGSGNDSASSQTNLPAMLWYIYDDATVSGSTPQSRIPNLNFANTISSVQSCQSIGNPPGPAPTPAPYPNPIPSFGYSNMQQGPFHTYSQIPPHAWISFYNQGVQQYIIFIQMKVAPTQTIYLASDGAAKTSFPNTSPSVAMLTCNSSVAQPSWNASTSTVSCGD